MRNPTLALTGVMLSVTPAAFAQGESILTAVNDVLNSPIMIVIGLALAVIGVWMWLVRQETAAGIMMIIGGVIITGIPAIFRGTSTVVTPFVEAVGAEQDFATDGNTVTDTR